MTRSMKRAAVSVISEHELEVNYESMSHMTRIREQGSEYKYISTKQAKNICQKLMSDQGAGSKHQ